MARVIARRALSSTRLDLRRQAEPREDNELQKNFALQQKQHGKRKALKRGQQMATLRLQILFSILLTLFPIACFSPQTHPVDTAPIPASARILEEPCSPTGALLCGGVSIFSGDTAVERRSACIVYVEPSGRRVEQCGSLPSSHP